MEFPYNGTKIPPHTLANNKPSIRMSLHPFGGFGQWGHIDP